MTAVFLHGLAGSRATYAWLPPTLAGHEVVRPDFRGHGAGERTPGAYLIAHYAADAIAVLSRVGPAFVVGHSLGGVAAWWAAQMVPDLVLGAVLEDPPLYSGEPAEHARSLAVPQFEMLRAVVADLQAQELSEAEVIPLLAAQPYGPDPSLRVGDVTTPEALAARAYALLHLDISVLDPVIDGSLMAATDVRSQIAVPLSVLAAGLVPAFRPDHEARLAVTHPGIEVVRLAGASHSIHDERAHRDAYLAHVVGFLERYA